MLKTILSIALTIVTYSAYAQYIEAKPTTGNKGCKAMIKKHIDYPESAIKSKTEGTVVIKFNTNITGCVTESEIIQNVSYDIDSAALALFNMIIWNPATYDGKPVKGTSEFEIKYQINNYKKLSKRRGYNHITPPYSPIDNSRIIYSLKQLTELPIPILENKYRTLNDYIYGNITYPEAASRLALEGTVELMFIIEPNGLTSNMVAIKHLGGGCTEEAMKIMETVNWHPGIKDNNAVRTKYNIKINFKKGASKDGYIPNQQGSGI